MMPTGQIYRTEHEEPEQGRWTRLEVSVEDGVVHGGQAETSSLPLLADTVKAVLEATRGRSINDVLDMDVDDVMQALGAGTAWRADDVAFSLRAVQQALSGRTY